MATKFSQIIDLTLDTNSAGDATPSLNIKENNGLRFEVLAVSGAHANHIVTLQTSSDDSNWTDTLHTITGLGVKDNIGTCAAFARLKVTTVETAASICKTYIQAK